MKISTEKQISYTNQCSNCPYVQLSPQHILSCPAIQSRLFKKSAQKIKKILSSFIKLLRLPKLYSTASEQSKASFYSSAHHGHANNSNPTTVRLSFLTNGL
ncbi:hypothetical protein TNCV_2837371 [Trichonephila clavipes]|nr:hypothetical protein TNCV_2837371 [Trichonephila clavipes]